MFRPGHMNKRAAMPIYGKNLIICRTAGLIAVKLCLLQSGIKCYKIYINGDPGLTLTSFTARSNLFPLAYE